MGGSSWSGSVRCVLVLLVVLALTGLVYAQGIQTSPYSNPSLLRGLPGTGGTNLAPPSPFGTPGSTAGSSTIPISSGMFQGILPPIPNLQFGYLYQFGNNVSAGRGTVDYLLPYSLNKNSVFFGEAHSEFQNLWNTLSSTFTSGTTTTTNGGFNNRVDVSLGGGARTILNKNTLLGMNGFYDTSRLGGTWYSSGSLGLQMAALLGGNDALDLNFNWYGKLFDSNVFTNAFRYGPSNFDFQAGYSHELWNGGPDFRMSATGYQFDIGNKVYGWSAGAELKSRDGMFVLKYDVGNDKVNQTYQTVGAFVNVGLQLENLFKGESPFTKPTPIFKSPRNLRRMLTQNVIRNWYPDGVLVHSRTQATLPWTSTVDLTVNATWALGTSRMILNPPPPGLLTSATSMTIVITGASTGGASVSFILNNGVVDALSVFRFFAGLPGFDYETSSSWGFAVGPDSPSNVRVLVGPHFFRPHPALLCR